MKPSIEELSRSAELALLEKRNERDRTLYARHKAENSEWYRAKLERTARDKKTRSGR